MGEKGEMAPADFIPNLIPLARRDKRLYLREKSRVRGFIIKKAATGCLCLGLFCAMAVPASWSQSPPETPAQKGANTPTYRAGGSATPRYGDVEVPKYGEIPMHKYELVPLESDNKPASQTDAPGVPQNEDSGGTSPGHPVTTGKSEAATPAVPAQKADFTGRYFGYEGKTLHTWDFYEDGTFLHTRILSGAGTSVRNSERGDFQLDGEYLELKIGKATTGALTPAVGGRDTLIAGGTEAKKEIRKLKIQFLKDGKAGILLDGKPLKVKTW